jgi:hypothetical protein
MCHKGFSGYSNILARSNFGVFRQESSPQSLTAHTLDRYQQGVKQKHIKNEHNYEIRRNLFLQTKKV